MSNTALARPSGRPASSMAAMVVSNVAGALAPAIAASSARCMSIALSSEALSSVTLNFSKRGNPPYGPVQGTSSGSSVTAAPFANDSWLRNAARKLVAAVVWRNVRLSMATPELPRYPRFDRRGAAASRRAARVAARARTIRRGLDATAARSQVSLLPRGRAPGQLGARQRISCAGGRGVADPGARGSIGPQPDHGERDRRPQQQRAQRLLEHADE